MVAGPRSSDLRAPTTTGVRAEPAARTEVRLAAPRRRRERSRILRRVDGLLFGFAGAAAVWLAYLLVRTGIRPGWPLLLLLPFWLVVTYLTLPRIHRILTWIYVPGYFIGRTRTSDGLLGDPVNLALRGSEAEVHAAMAAAGWTRADDLSLRTGLHIVSTTLRRRSYGAAPVSPLHLFDRQQDFAYQQQVAGNPSKRHHVRFWRCPDGWFLPGGSAVDWLAAGTYDRSVGLSLFTLQVTHKIEADTDVERDFIVSTIRQADPDVDVEVIRHFSSGFHARNGGGDRIETDGDLPVVGVGPSPDPPEAAAVGPTDSRDRRPAQTVFGAAVALVRSLLFLLAAVSVFVAPETLVRLTRSGSDLTQLLAERVFGVVFAVVLALFALVELGLGLATLAGRNWARLWLMASAVSTTVGAFASNLTGSKRVTLLGLPTVATAILLLLALTSQRAREFADRDHRRTDTTGLDQKKAAAV
jgi:LssY C-terminus